MEEATGADDSTLPYHGPDTRWGGLMLLLNMEVDVFGAAAYEANPTEFHIAAAELRLDR